MTEHIAVELQDQRFAQRHIREALENSCEHLEIAGDLLLITRSKLADAHIAIQHLYFLIGEPRAFDSRRSTDEVPMTDWVSCPSVSGVSRSVRRNTAPAASISEMTE